MRELEAPKAAIASESTSLHPIPRLAPQVIEDRLEEWRRLLRGSTKQGRTVLQRILRGRLTFTPRLKRDEFRQVNQRRHPESEWLRADAPQLRIVDEALWKRVQSRRREAETLAARMTFTPRLDPLTGEPDGYDFSGPTRFDKLFTGIAVETPAWAKNRTWKTGPEDIDPENTFDGDYGRLLERAYEKSVKVLASLMPASWNQIAIWLQQVDGLRRAA